MAGSFAQFSTQVPENRYLGTKASNALAGASSPFYTSGLMKYWMFVPDPAAVAAAGLTGQKLPCLMQAHAQGGGEWSGTLAAPTGNPNGAVQLTGQPGDKLGFNTTPDANWPTYVVFPQLTLDWDAFGDNAGTSSGTRKHRAGWAIMEAVMKDAMTRYPIDRDRLYLTGVSSGGSESFSYLYARARFPKLFTIDFAAFIGVATYFGLSSRSDYADSGATYAAEVYTPTTSERVARVLAKHGVPMYLVNSMSDEFIGPGDYVSMNGFLMTHAMLMRYWPPRQPVQALTSPARDYIDCGPNLQIIRYTTGAPLHNATWPMAYSNNVPGAAMNVNDPMWAWMMTKRRSAQRSKRRAY